MAFMATLTTEVMAMIKVSSCNPPMSSGTTRPSYLISKRVKQPAKRRQTKVYHHSSRH